MTTPRSPARLLLSVLAAVAALSATGATADEKKKSDHEAARQALLRKEVLPLTRILAIAAKRAPGEVIEVELERADGGRLKYDLKILAPNGRVRELELDAKTGATLKLEDD
ncbi:MAG: PepSY domain-containing protein [Caulobacter sp.]